MTTVEVFDGGSDPLFTNNFEAIPRKGEYLYYNGEFFAVSAVWHNLPDEGVAQVQIDIEPTDQAWAR